MRAKTTVHRIPDRRLAQGTETVTDVENSESLVVGAAKFLIHVITGNLITMLGLLKDTTFSTAIHRASDIIKDIRTTFETQTLDCWKHCVILTLNKEVMSEVKYSKWVWRKNPA